MRNVWIGAAALAAVSAMSAPAFADTEVTVENVQAAVAVYMGKGQVTVANWRGTGSGANDWGMQRRVTGAQTTQRCVTVLQAPVVIFQAGAGAANPSKTYGVDWGKLSDIERDGKIIVFHAEHMAADENGEFDFPNEQEAETFETVMNYLVGECSKR